MVSSASSLRAQSFAKTKQTQHVRGHEQALSIFPLSPVIQHNVSRVSQDEANSRREKPRASPFNFPFIASYSEQRVQSFPKTKQTRHDPRARIGAICTFNISLPIPCISGHLGKLMYASFPVPRELSQNPFMILPQVHLRKPCYDFYFL